MKTVNCADNQSVLLHELTEEYVEIGYFNRCLKDFSLMVMNSNSYQHNLAESSS